MGSGASTPNPANDEDTVAAVLTYSPSDFNLDDTAWIKIYHSYETPDSFSATTYSIKLDSAASLLSQPEEILSINGFCWKYLAQDDEDELIHQLEYFDPFKKQLIFSKCQETYLYNKYHENYSKPYNLHPDQVFTTLSFLVKTPDNKIASTELSGCIPQSEHLTAMGNPKKPSSGSGSTTFQRGESLEDAEAHETLRKGNWSSRLKDLLPGDKFEESRAEIRQLLMKADTLLDESTKGIHLFPCKSRLYLYYKRQCQSYQHLIQEGITTEKGEKHMNEYEHWKNLVKQETDKMFNDLLDGIFDKAESLLLSVIPSTSASFPDLIPSLQKLKLRLHSSFVSEVFRLADLLDQQETNAFEQLHLRFNHNSSTPTTPSTSAATNAQGIAFPSSSSSPKNSSKSGVAVDVRSSSRSGRRQTKAAGNTPSRRTMSPSSKPGERRPLSATNNFVMESTVTIAEEKESPRTGRRKTLDSSESPNTSSTPPTPALTTATVTTRKTSTTPSPPSSASSLNPLQIIKHASYQISKQKLIKKFEMRKFHQSTQQDKQFIHSIRFEIIFYIFSLIIKEAMASYMLKEFNLLENKLLSQSSKEMEDLNVLQAKELASYLHEQREENPVAAVAQEGGEGDGTDTSKKEKGARNGAVASAEAGDGGEGSRQDKSGGIPKLTLESSSSVSRVYSKQSSSIQEPLSSFATHAHHFHTPLDLKSIDDVNLLKQRHEENKAKLENYLSEKRRQKRKYFDDAKKVTFEKLTSKLNDIRVDSENAMLSPGGLGKYKAIMKIVNLMKSNAK